MKEVKILKNNFFKKAQQFAGVVTETAKSAVEASKPLVDKAVTKAEEIKNPERTQMLNSLKEAVSISKNKGDATSRVSLALEALTTKANVIFNKVIQKDFKEILELAELSENDINKEAIKTWSVLENLEVKVNLDSTVISRSGVVIEASELTEHEISDALELCKRIDVNLEDEVQELTDNAVKELLRTKGFPVKEEI